MAEPTARNGRADGGTDEGRDHDRGTALMLARPTAVQLPGDNGVLFKAHGSRRDPKPVDESLARDLASDAGEMIVRTWLCLEAGEVGCLAGKALYSGGTDVIEGAATGNSDEMRGGVKKILTAVQAQVATELVGKALEEIDAVNTRMVTNSAGTPVPQTVVNVQDELLAEAEKAAGGSLDDFTERKPGRWISKDGLKQIEWSPEGHANTNEGPHVTVQERSGTRERWRVTKKAFIDGRRNY